MIYNRSPDLDWDGISDSAVFRILPHHVVAIGSKLLLLSRGGPGWAFVESTHLQKLRSINGQRFAALRQYTQTPEARKAIDKLYQVGLVEVDGATGLRGVRQTVDRMMTTAESVPTQLVQIQPVRRAYENGVRSTIPHTLLIKLTGACNWACSYCYDYSPTRFNRKLVLDDLKPVIEEMLDKHTSISLMFHGGEPLLSFSEMKRICLYAEQRAAKRGAQVSFSIQTNGSLLNDDVVQFLRSHSFGIGMSIDGPSRINDLTRMDHQGHGTAQTMMEMFERYPKFMTEEVGYITTVTSLNVDSLCEIAEYLRQLGVRSWKTAVFDPEGRGVDRADLRVSVKPYVAFMKWIVEQCCSGGWHTFRMRTLLDLLTTVLTSERTNLCLKFPCGAGKEFAVASADKTLLACDATYSASFALGRLEHGLAAAQNSFNARSLAEREAWLLDEAECSSCLWLHFCAGTCMAKGLIKHGTIKAVDDFECAVRKELFPLIFQKLGEPNSPLLNYYRAEPISRS